MFLQMCTIVFAQIRIHQTSAPPCSASACTGPRTCSRTHKRYMNENFISSLRLYLSLKNSGKSSVVVWKNLPTGGPADTQTYPRVNLSILGTTLG